jgi:hypothetical protein
MEYFEGWGIGRKDSTKGGFDFGPFSAFLVYLITICEPGSSVGIANDYGLDGPGIESRWGEIFRTRPDRPWGQPNLLYNGYRVFPEGKSAGAWRWLPTSPSAEVENEQSYTSAPPLGPGWPVMAWTLPLPLQNTRGVD